MGAALPLFHQNGFRNGSCEGETCKHSDDAHEFCQLCDESSCDKERGAPSVVIWHLGILLWTTKTGPYLQEGK